MESEQLSKPFRIDGCHVSRRNEKSAGETWDVFRGGARLGTVSIFTKYFLVALQTQGMSEPTLRRKVQRSRTDALQDEERAVILSNAVSDLKSAV